MEINNPENLQFQNKRKARNSSIKKTMITAVVARISGFLLQVLSLPVAANQLGAAGFTIYAMLGSILAAMTLSNMGIGPATTLHISRVLATGKARTGKEIFLSSLIIAAGIASTLTFIFVLLIIYSPLVNTIFAQQIVYLPAPIEAALFVCMVFFSTQVLSVFEASQLAHQRQHKLNIIIAIGTLISTVSVWYVSVNQPSVLDILLAVHLPVIIGRTLNAIGVWFEINPGIRNFLLVSKHFRVITMDGLRFVSGTTIANFLCHPLSVFAIGLYLTPQASVSYVAVMSAVILMSAVFLLITAPMQPTLAEASRIGDSKWVRKAVIFMFAANFLFGLIFFLALGIIGEKIFYIWYRGAVVPSSIELWGAGLYILVMSIEISNFIFLSSIGFLKIVSRWTLLKAVIASVLLIVPISLNIPGLQFWILSGASVLLSIIPLGIIAATQTPLNGKI